MSFGTGADFSLLIYHRSKYFAISLISEGEAGNIGFNSSGSEHATLNLPPLDLAHPWPNNTEQAE